jgi:2-iminobutanoate/2-iminopropanoate deaminase
MRNAIQTTLAPQAIGPYSQAVHIAAGPLLFTAGQLGIDPATGQLCADIAGQTRQALQNLAAILQAAGTDLQGVVKTTVFLQNLSDFDTMNKVYAEFFPQQPPARTTVQVARLPKDALVEIEAIAVTP